MHLLAFVLDRAPQVCQHLLVEPDHFVVIHLVFDLPAVLWAHLEGLGLLSEITLAEGSLLRGIDLIYCSVSSFLLELGALALFQETYRRFALHNCSR